MFDGARHESMARHPDIAERAVVISSFGKTYHTTGWKIGYCVAPQALAAEVARVHQWVTYAVNTPIQRAYAEIVNRDPTCADVTSFYQAKRDRFLELLEGSRFRPLACRGTFFQVVDYSAITDEHDADFAIRLTKEHGVAAIPISPFLVGRRAGPRAALLLRQAGRDVGGGRGTTQERVVPRPTGQGTENMMRVAPFVVAIALMPVVSLTSTRVPLNPEPWALRPVVVQDRPLPDAEALYRTVRENLARAERVAHLYTYKERRTDVHTNPFGKLGTGGTSVFEVYPSPTRRLALSASGRTRRQAHPAGELAEQDREYRARAAVVLQEQKAQASGSAAVRDSRPKARGSGGSAP